MPYPLENLTPMEELNLMIEMGWGDTPQKKLPEDWRTRKFDGVSLGRSKFGVCKHCKQSFKLRIRKTHEKFCPAQFNTE